MSLARAAAAAVSPRANPVMNTSNDSRSPSPVVAAAVAAIHNTNLALEQRRRQKQLGRHSSSSVNRAPLMRMGKGGVVMQEYEPSTSDRSDNTDNDTAQIAAISSEDNDLLIHHPPSVNKKDRNKELLEDIFSDLASVAQK